MSEKTKSEYATPEFAFACQPVLSVSPGSGKEDVLRAMVGALVEAGKLRSEDGDPITRALVARERDATTALGKGLAFPHLRSRRITSFCGAIARSPQGIDFGALDGQPTRLIVLTLSPFEARREHAELLGRLCSLLSDQTIQYALQAPRGREELLSLLRFSD